MGEGFYREIEPVAVVPLSNTEALHRAFSETIARGNPRVPILKGAEFPPAVVLKYAGVKNWRTFARGTSTWGLSARDGSFRIQGYRKDGTGWVPEKTTSEIFPPGATADSVIERMIAILRSGAQEPAKSK